MSVSLQKISFCYGYCRQETWHLAQDTTSRNLSIGMAKAAESVGCGNEIEDSIRDKAIKIPSWPLYIL